MKHQDEQDQVAEAPRFLRKHGDPYLYPYTAALALRRDMYEVADPNAPPKEPKGVKLDAREAEVLGITNKPGLVAFADAHGIELPDDATTVKSMQRAIRLALLSRDEDDDETPAPKADKPAKAAPKAAKPPKAPKADKPADGEGTDGSAPL